ncbi:hypothetical protein LBLM1_11220 (plasmid) [Limosilactobacillus mucosae LM1]|uniref:Uncharacterized protein n=1 Tax=Limosilactobacillus mucosae LM1 TaxID=1130798 RepID=A0A0D4CNU5_LIMMU|nr:hypothetical protein [Limosilactobacillus mucosae]AJT51590.1 hypothetical protein LBLM1_11220 [Limosilactobacillus mucosae LM1]
MKNVVVNTSIVMVVGASLIPIVLAVVFIPLLRYLAGLFLFYLLFQLALNGVIEEVKAEQQAKIVEDEEQSNKKAA